MTNWGMIILGVTVLAIVLLYMYMEHGAEKAEESIQEDDETPKD